MWDGARGASECAGWQAARGRRAGARGRSRALAAGRGRSWLLACTRGRSWPLEGTHGGSRSPAGTRAHARRLVAACKHLQQALAAPSSNPFRSVLSLRSQNRACFSAKLASFWLPTLLFASFLPLTLLAPSFLLQTLPAAACSQARVDATVPRSRASLIPAGSIATRCRGALAGALPSPARARMSPRARIMDAREHPLSDRGHHEQANRAPYLAASR